MNWMTVADRAENKKCQQARKYGSCNCNTKKNVNPCKKLETIRQSCVNFDLGEPGEISLVEIQKWASYQVCNASKNSRSCNHKGCIVGEQVIDFLSTAVMKPATLSEVA